MPYLGSTPNASFSSRTKQDFTANGSTTAFTLSSAVASANDIEVFVGNVRQEPTDAYTVSGTTLTMSEAPATGLNFYVVFKGLEENSVVPADGTISSAKIASSAVTDAKIASGAVTDAKIASGISSSKLTGALPAIDGSALTNVTTPFVGFGVRGMLTVTTLSSYGAAYRFAASWATTDVNQGSLLHANGYGLVPSGQAGVYQISYFANHGNSTNYMQIALIRYIAATTSYQTLMADLRANDYNYYTVGGTVIVDLAVGDQIFAGYNNTYASVALNESSFNRFSMHKIG